MIWGRIKAYAIGAFFGLLMLGTGLLALFAESQKHKAASLKQQRDDALQKAANATTQAQVTTAASEAAAAVTQAPPPAPDLDKREDFDNDFPPT